MTFEFAEWILRNWRFGVLEGSKGAFCCCKYSFVISFLHEYMFDVRGCDLNSLIVERFLDFKHLT